ncbi:MAG: hypothetical protein H5U06_02375 [Candidatus Aminicenantes bacterium]|nr:hypothetical protein [Candidatus Aminicenantes bacterium]
MKNTFPMKTGSLQKYNKSSIQGVTGDRKRECLLELSLLTLVVGENASGKKFKENTELMTISSKQASFRLKTPVKIGTPLKLTLNVPATLFLIHPLKLEISGKISRVEINSDKKFLQLVTIELDRRFQLHPVSQTSHN